MVEGLVALGILAMVFMSLLSGFTNIFKIEMNTTHIVNEQQILAMIIESVKAEPTAFVKDFSKKDSLDILTPSNLPLGYTKSYYGPKDGCGPLGCEAYIGYTLQPLSGFQGLFKGTILVYRPKKENGKIATDENGDMVAAKDETKFFSFLINSN